MTELIENELRLFENQTKLIEKYVNTETRGQNWTKLWMNWSKIRGNSSKIGQNWSNGEQNWSKWIRIDKISKQLEKLLQFRNQLLHFSPCVSDLSRKYYRLTSAYLLSSKKHENIYWSNIYKRSNWKSFRATFIGEWKNIEPNKQTEWAGAMV